MKNGEGWRKNSLGQKKKVKKHFFFNWKARESMRCVRKATENDKRDTDIEIETERQGERER